MKVSEFIALEEHKLREFFHLDPLEPRTWDCEPLLVLDDRGVIAFNGPTNVRVIPHPDGTANLFAEGEIDGWRPSLVGALVKLYGMPSAAYNHQRRRGGVVCTGLDADGNAFAWYINGAAEGYFEGGWSDPAIAAARPWDAPMGAG